MILNVASIGSTGTGVAPVYETESQDAMYVFEGTITSSPGPIFNAFNEIIKASNPFATPIEYFVLE